MSEVFENKIKELNLKIRELEDDILRKDKEIQSKDEEILFLFNMLEDELGKGVL